MLLKSINYIKNPEIRNCTGKLWHWCKGAHAWAISSSLLYYCN